MFTNLLNKKLSFIFLCLFLASSLQAKHLPEPDQKLINALGAWFWRTDKVNAALTQQDVNVNCVTKEGLTPLEIAFKKNDLKTAQILLRHGANPNVTDKHKRTLLERTVVDNKTTHTGLLLDHGANPNAPSAFSMSGPIGFNAHSDAMMGLLIEKGFNINAKKQDGTPIFLDKYFYYSPSNLSLHIKHGLDITKTDKNNNTLLHQSNDPKIITLALKNGLQPTLKNIKGETPLHCSTSAEKTKILLEAGAPVDEKDNNGLTPLFALLHNKIKYSYDNNFYGKEVSENEIKSAENCVKHLLSYHAEPNIIDKEGKTILHYAANWISPTIIQSLLQHGSNPKIQDVYGQTALHLAACAKTTNTITTHYYCNGSFTGSYTRTIETINTLEELLKNKEALEDINLPTKNGLTPLHCALLIAKSLKRTGLLLTYKANPDTIFNPYDNTNNTFLHDAAKNNNFELVQMFLENNANIQLLNNEGKTALELTTDAKIKKLFSEYKTKQYKFKRFLSCYAGHITIGSIAASYATIAALNFYRTLPARY